jgi:hypothetical protein
MLKVVVVNPPTEEQKEQIYKNLEKLYEEEYVLITK